MIGLSKIGGVIKTEKPFYVEAYSGKSKLRASSISAESSFTIFKRLGYVKIKGDSIFLADKGKGFVDYLLLNGWVCDMLNDQVFTEGYVPSFKRRNAAVKK
jgi:hypothetical protein